MKSMKKLLIVAAVIAVVAVVSLGSCSAGWFDFLGGNNTTNANLTGQEVNLAAAASLKNAFDKDLIPMFEKKYPGVKVTPTYASSGDLQTQIENGLKADVFMSAANKQMNKLANESLVNNSTNVQFLENKVVLIVPKDSKLNNSTDAKSNGDVKVVCEAPDGALKTPVIYPVAMLKDPAHPEAAKEFMNFLQTKEAKDVFVEYGFTIHE